MKLVRYELDGKPRTPPLNIDSAVSCTPQRGIGDQ